MISLCQYLPLVAITHMNKMFNQHRRLRSSLKDWKVGRRRQRMWVAERECNKINIKKTVWKHSSMLNYRQIQKWGMSELYKTCSQHVIYIFTDLIQGLRKGNCTMLEAGHLCILLFWKIETYWRWRCSSGCPDGYFLLAHLWISAGTNLYFSRMQTLWWFSLCAQFCYFSKWFEWGYMV